MHTCNPHGVTPQEDFTLTVKTALLRRGETVSGLARKLRKSRNAVSRAINTDQLPTVQTLIRKELAL